MSARHQAPLPAYHCSHAACASVHPFASVPFAFASAPVASLPAASICMTARQAPTIVPGGQTIARAFPVLTANGAGPFTSYPPTHAADADEALLHTYASFSEEPILALSASTRRNDSWTLCVPVPLPSTANPTLRSLTYMLKYATTGDDGNATVQTDILLTTAQLAAGVIPGAAPLSVYRQSSGYAPRMVDQAAAQCLATALAVKCNGGGEAWSHFLDVQHIAPNVRVGAGAQLYLMFHVAEYPTARTLRSLSVEVSATWQKEEVERKAREEAERKVREAEEKAAQEAADKKSREEDERLVREEERQWREDERQCRKAEAQERAEAKEDREEAKKVAGGGAPGAEGDGGEGRGSTGE
ncbi:hypothetical protein DFH09DRAFT_1079873 [Mycena vulgaris]|nr:hypothetical protein DFH09DRAFT_1079873 [Mycena vulgaris]